MFKHIGQLIKAYRKPNGSIWHYYDDRNIDEMFYSLAPGLQEIDSTRAGIGFCYDAQNNHIHEVTNNDAPDYHPTCTGTWSN